MLLPLMVEGFRFSRGKFKTAKVLRSSEVQRWEPCYHLTLSHNGTSNHPEVNISILYWQCSAVFTSCTRSLASVHRAGGGHWKHWTLCIVLWMERRSWNIGSPDNRILVLRRLTHFIKNWGWRWRKYGCFCFIFKKLLKFLKSWW